MSNDVINIHLAVPKPIVFHFDDGSGTPVTLSVDGRVSVEKALALRRLDQELEEAETTMYTAIAAAQNLALADDVKPAALQRATTLVEESMVAFEKKAEELVEYTRLLFREQPDSVPFGHGDIRHIASVIWSRAFGATDQELERLSDDGEESGPPPKARRSTSRSSSKGSARSTAATRTNGSSGR